MTESDANFDIIVSDQDRSLARVALIQGHDNCPLSDSDFVQTGRGHECGCDLNAIDGCKARVEAIAFMIAKNHAESKRLRAENQFLYGQLAAQREAYRALYVAVALASTAQRAACAKSVRNGEKAELPNDAKGA